MKPSQAKRRQSLNWQLARLGRLRAAQKRGNMTDQQLVRMRTLVVSVANLQKKRKT